MSDFYKLKGNSKILDIGCGKGYLLYDFLKILPNATVRGIDISKYAIENSKDELKENLTVGNAINLPYEDNYFDLSFQLIHYIVLKLRICLNLLKK